MEINYRDPPNSSDFSTLFCFIWDNGIGNKLDKNEIPTPWTAESLEAAFDGAGFSTDKRTIQNWHSGSNLPSRRNMHALAKIISAGSDASNRKWADALFATRKAPDPQVKTGHRSDELTVKPDATVTNPIKSGAKPQNKIILTLFIGLGIAASLAIYLTALPKSPSVRNIMFCDEARFSKIDKICRENIHIYPGDTKMIYTSFEIVNMPVGEPFDRRWYRDGRWFKTKSGHFDIAWEGYTFLYNPNTHDSGDYVMRIIVDDKSTTGSFTVLD